MENTAEARDAITAARQARKVMHSNDYLYYEWVIVLDLGGVVGWAMYGSTFYKSICCLMDCETAEGLVYNSLTLNSFRLFLFVPEVGYMCGCGGVYIYLQARDATSFK